MYLHKNVIIIKAFSSTINVIFILIGLDGQRVILFGGRSFVSGSTTFTSGDSLYVLNLINFEWYIPKISGQIPKVRTTHKAHVIGKYMVISFGKYNLIYNFDYSLQKINFY